MPKRKKGDAEPSDADSGLLQPSDAASRPLLGESPIASIRRELVDKLHQENATSEVVSIEALTPDPVNRRLHPDRNLKMVSEALLQVGAGRSIVIDETDTVLAGNGVTAAAKAAGLTTVRIIESDGHELIAVRRRGLTDEQKRQLAMYDNRTAELAEWDAEQLAADLRDGSDLTAFFLPEELNSIFGEPQKHPVEFMAVDENVETQHRCPKCGYEWSGSAAPGVEADESA